MGRKGAGASRHGAAPRRVPDGSGVPVPGLHAAGNDLASVMGGNRLGGGITPGPAMTFGCTAAHHMAGCAGRKAAEHGSKFPKL